MKKTFFLLIISLISLNLFAEGKITYNKNIKNPKNFVIDNLDNSYKNIYENLEYLRSMGINDFSLFNCFKEIEYPEGTLLIMWKYEKEYVSSNFSKDIKKFISEARPALRLYFKNKNETKYTKAVDQKYFKVGDKTEKASVYYYKTEEYSIENEVPFTNAILSYEIVEFLNKKNCITLPCYIVPFKTIKNENWDKATSSDEIIELFGMPDSIEKYSFSWPDQKTMNGIYYSPEVNKPVWGEHWRFKKFPDLVIDISGKVNNFATDRNIKFYRISTEEQ